MAHLKSFHFIRKNRKPKQPLDPLTIIFQYQLFHSKAEPGDRISFIQGVVESYLSYLKKKDILVPLSLNLSLREELADQIKRMLLTQTYGSVSLSEYREKISENENRRVQACYARLNRTQV